MTAEIINLEEYRKEKINKQNILPENKLKNKSDSSKGISSYSNSEEFCSIDNGEPI
tara:strand:+ start:264 stop:431 length:168 start_codon:yes stop_codon:yes gene_type:complete